MGHAKPEYLELGAERIGPSRPPGPAPAPQEADGSEGMLAFLNGCETAETGATPARSWKCCTPTGSPGRSRPSSRRSTTSPTSSAWISWKGSCDGAAAGRADARPEAEMSPAGAALRRPLPARDPVRAPGAGARTPARDRGDRPCQLAAWPWEHPTAQARPRRRFPPGLKLPEKPYRSLGHYDSEDRLLFTGREADMVRFSAALDVSSTRMVVLHGESGLGKSSFLRAGVIALSGGPLRGLSLPEGGGRPLRDHPAGE